MCTTVFRRLALPPASLSIPPEASLRSPILGFVFKRLILYLQEAFGLLFTFLTSCVSKSLRSCLVKCRSLFLHTLNLAASRGSSDPLYLCHREFFNLLSLRA